MDVANQVGNLCADTQKTRVQIGVIAVGIGLALGAVMLDQGAPVPVRLMLFLPFFLASQALLAGLFNSCIGLASRGMRDVGDGPEKIASPEVRASTIQLARRVSLMGLALALVATALFVVVP